MSLGWGWGWGRPSPRMVEEQPSPLPTPTHTLLRPLGGDAHALGVCGEYPLTTAV